MSEQFINLSIEEKRSSEVKREKVINSSSKSNSDSDSDSNSRRKWHNDNDGKVADEKEYINASRNVKRKSGCKSAVRDSDGEKERETERYEQK